MQSEPDELYTLRNLFWLGNYQMAINEASKLNRIQSKLLLERDEYVYRSYLGLGQFNIVLNEIAEKSIGLKAVKLLALSYKDEAQIESLKIQAASLLQGGDDSSTVKLILAIFSIKQENWKDAIKYLSPEGNLEQ
jgi:coatomer protein complex subunit epsilon